MKKILMLLVISLSTAACAVWSVARPDDSINPIVVQKALESGVAFTSNQVQYQLILGGRAVRHNTNNVAALSASTASSNLWSEKKGTYQIFIADETSDAFLKTMSSSGNNFNQIAFNPNTGNVAIIIGEIIVKLKSGITAESIASIYNINLADNFQQINTAIYRVNEWQNIFTIAEQLNLNPSIEFAELDVIERFPKPM